MKVRSGSKFPVLAPDRFNSALKSIAVETRPLTVGLSIFSSTGQGVDGSVVTAATLMTSGLLLIAFLFFQRQFVQSFMRAGIE